MMGWWHSRRLRFLTACAAALLILMVLLRAVFYLFFSEVGDTVDAPAGQVWRTLSVGLRFDLRLTLLMVLPLAVLAWLPRFNLVRSRAARGLALVYLGLATLLLLLTYILDFGHYVYLGDRLNITVLRFLQDTRMSTQMVWESYPVVWITLGWLALSALLVWLFARLSARFLLRDKPPIRTRSLWAGGVVVVLVLAFGLLGRATDINWENPVPLRWSDAFASGDKAVAALGLNPVLFFYDTSQLDTEPYDLEAVRRYYPMMADFLALPADRRGDLNYRRHVTVQPHRLDTDRPPNIVVVMLESLGASRVGAYGTPFDPTPNLDRIAEGGWFFEHFYVPVTGTAKSIWAFLTGIPDVAPEETASRNPLIGHQRMIVDQLDGYRKLYMVGGNAGWANLEGLLTRSIDGLELYEEGDWQSPNVDVWGISDLALFKESHAILDAIPDDQPFFAFIQTAGNHRPFTIPPNNDDFQVRDDLSEEQLNGNGFKNAAQYNAVRLLDYNVGRFMDLARQSDYFDNTLFVFFGDHNNRITTLPHMPRFQEALRLESHHVPHMIYAPKLLEPRRIREAVSLIDVMPTVAGLIGLDYDNTTLGRDIQQPAPEGDRTAFVVLREGPRPQIGAVTADHLARLNHDGEAASLHTLYSDNPEQDRSETDPDTFNHLFDLARGFYETSRYLFYDNAIRDRQSRAITDGEQP
ncbi:LTA synthase family protein [Alloalcanivorax marinus]|uniref:LTA synthase family protein n=1 Tax=Alloalcanivorax marinus TaxID=1177169 RepID=UPI0021D16097|nr:LTA synthase family protein [Alloalcanivorax marinus]MCU5787339.1 phosphoglycerol transferase [Alloalcanivorax marinus]